jgi:hypothetical protein
VCDSGETVTMVGISGGDPASHRARPAAHAGLGVNGVLFLESR